LNDLQDQLERLLNLNPHIKNQMNLRVFELNPAQKPVDCVLNFPNKE